MGDDEMRQLNVPALQDDGYIFLWVTGSILCSQQSVVQSVRVKRERGERERLGIHSTMSCGAVYGLCEVDASNSIS